MRVAENVSYVGIACQVEELRWVLLARSPDNILHLSLANHVPANEGLHVSIDIRLGADNTQMSCCSRTNS
jgi:hypothetical protein